MREVPAPLAMTSTMRRGSSPALAPSTIASAAAALCTATSRLDEFHQAAVAERAEVVTDPGEGGEHVMNARERGLVAAAVQREIARPGLRPGARQRTVQQRHSDRAQPVVRHLLRLKRKGAEFGDDCSRNR